MKRLSICIALIIIIQFFAEQTTESFTINNSQYVSDEIIIKFKQGAPEGVQERIIEALGARLFKRSYKNRFMVIRVPEGSVQNMVHQFSRHPIIAYAVPNYLLELYFIPDDTYYDYQWNFSLINMEQAWDISQGEGVTVAVIDTGVHPKGRDGFGDRLLAGYDAILGANNGWEDFNSHGTHVAGTIAQNTDNNTGVAGIAFKATILPVKVLPRRGRSLIALSWVVDGIDWAVDHGADIINLSLGGSEPAEPLEDAVNDAVNSGVTVIAAAGNDGGPVGYPAAYENVIAVGAIDYRKELTFYSNFGPQIDIVAPGGIPSQDPNGDGKPDGGVLQETFSEYLGFRFFAFGWRYYFFAGTSMATPHVAGVAALIKSIHRNWTPEQIRDALINTAEDLGSPGKDNLYGYGMVDAYAAVTY